MSAVTTSPKNTKPEPEDLSFLDAFAGVDDKVMRRFQETIARRKAERRLRASMPLPEKK